MYGLNMIKPLFIITNEDGDIWYRQPNFSRWVSMNATYLGLPNRLYQQSFHQNHYHGTTSVFWKTERGVKKYFENNNKNEEIIKKEIYENTFFDRCFEVWNITNLARKYQITGKEVFISFVKNNQPFGMGYFDNL